MEMTTKYSKLCSETTHLQLVVNLLTSPGERRPCQGGGKSHVARLNFKTSCVGVYKCLSLIVGFAVTVAIWPREVVSCCNFILRAVARRNLPWQGLREA